MKKKIKEDFRERERERERRKKEKN